MPAQFVYGLRGGRYTHVRDLDPDIDRGRACGCSCPECKRPLLAHMGDTKAWHFQHVAEDVSCNPQPMTMLHAFVRDRLAEKRRLWLPGEKVRLSIDVYGQTFTEWGTIPDKEYVFETGRTEVPLDGVQPDVVFKVIPSQWDLAIEVRYTHAVDHKKALKLQALFKDSLEFDVSDLAANGISEGELDAVLGERHRWKWISWMDRVRLESSFKSRAMWEQRDWTPDIGFFSKVFPYKPPAVAKLRDAQNRMSWAEQQLPELRARASADKASWLGAQTLTDRIAIVCAAIGLQPNTLPVFFQQRVQLSMERHPYAWQLPIFAKFGVGTKAFTSREVESWMRHALPDCVLENGRSRSKNGFSRTQAAAHSFLLQLEEQGLLTSDEHSEKALRVFMPQFATRSELLSFLQQ